jgi:hypothetical protein
VDTGQRTGSQPAALSEPARRRRLIPRRPHWLAVVEAGIAAALLVATFFVHNTSYLLSTPFWNDEEWVAISTKLPLHDLARDSASTPLGWGLLLRLMVFGGQQRYRLVPLAFAGLGAVAAYALARSLPWRSRWVAISAATLAGVVTLFAPSSLVRDDLKQYTSDAFVTLILLWLLARLEANWSARRFSQLLVAVVLGFLFSAPAAFVGAAVLLSYGLVCLIKGQWRRFAIVAGSSLLAGGALGRLAWPGRLLERVLPAGASRLGPQPAVSQWTPAVSDTLCRDQECPCNAGPVRLGRRYAGLAETSCCRYECAVVAR